MNDPMDHATGIEKRELLARAAGNDDPFDMKVFKRGAGTKESPNMIPSAFDARLVGCICKFQLSCLLILQLLIFSFSSRRRRTNLCSMDVALPGNLNSKHKQTRTSSLIPEISILFLGITKTL